ncbi:fimbrial protein [Providencia manganoxydans]|uniref:fimbrial protein n=1 Tax=Providencia manganoxydans TaxID=2923283 RepID=UPI0034E4BA38
MKSLRNVFLIYLFQIGQSLAIPETSYSTNYIRDINISGPADQIPYGEVIKNPGSWSGIGICNNSDIQYTLSRVEYEPIAQWTGQTYKASSAHPTINLFETGISGFSFAPMGGMSNNAPNDFKPLPISKTIVWQGNMNNSARLSSPIRVTIGVYIYKGPDRITGSLVIPSQKMYRYVCYDQAGKAQEATSVMYNAINVNATISSCTPTNKVITLDMDKIPASLIKNSDALTNIGTKQQTFSLLCDPNVQVFASVVDLADTTNKSTVSKLTPNSSASGIGFSVTNSSGQRLQFGPDGSATNIPGQQKYFIQKAGNSDKNNPISYSLGFSYVRKPEEVFKTGTAISVIGITYSYQ